MKEMIEDFKISRIAYLIEILEKKEFDDKIKAFRKIERMKITKNIGLFLIENSYKNFEVDDDFGGIGTSLIELCFKNYYEEYTDAIKKIFSKLNSKSQKRVIYLLTTTSSESALNLYADLVLKYLKDDNIPIGSLHNRPETYTYIFPKLYKALKSKNINNNVLILISNYLNSGVVPKEDLKKNKKAVIDSICKVFDSALKYKNKYKNTYEALNNVEYKNIRFFLEIAINIELYVSNTKTKDYLVKLYKKNDNQLKLFILDNYFRTGKDVKQLNLNPPAKDPASRYALYEFLNAYDRLELFPKKYFTIEQIAESDFYTNFVITNGYTYEPKNIKLYKVVERNGYNYYIFKFKCTYEYNLESNDFLTNYICNVVGLEKYNGKKITSDFIGISGGYNKKKEISSIEKNLKSLLYKKVDNTSNIDEIIDELLPKKEEKNEEISKKKKTKLSIKKKDKIKKDKKKKEKESKKLHIFDYVLLSLLFIFEAMLIYCMLYVSDIADIGGGIRQNPFKTTYINKELNFEEINGSDIYQIGEEEYYVLLYKKKNDNKNAYYTYINEYLKRNIKFYYVNLNDEKNKFLYEPNYLNFTVTKDRLLKVKNCEYIYFVDGRVNILNEMKKEIDDIKIKEAKEKKEQVDKKS